MQTHSIIEEAKKSSTIRPTVPHQLNGYRKEVFEGEMFCSAV